MTARFTLESVSHFTMKMIVLGINHNSASVEVRERVAFAPEQVGEALTDVCAVACLSEAVILSTCNRTELYVIPADGAEAEVKAEQLLAWVANYHHLSAEDLQGAAYHHHDDAALQHVMQVASGLDSMVLGEPQILGQMKSAYAVASGAGTVSAELGRLFRRVFSVAKRVRTDTAIGENPVSVAYAAVALSGHIFSDLKSTSALLIGAGETIELVARHLIDAGVKQIVIANRTLGRAKELAQKFSADAILLSEIPARLQYADMVISSTASQLPILGKGAVEDALKARKHKPMLMIDIAVPRDIEPQVGELSDVYLYSVDDLREIVDQNLRGRKKEARKADLIIAQAVLAYGEEVLELAAVDTVKAYRQQAEQAREYELSKAMRLLTRGDDPEKVLEQLSRGLTHKLIHAPSTGLKKLSAAGREDLVAHAKELLGLESQPEKKAAETDAEKATFSVISTDTSEQTLQ
ncbi:MAG: glutamyl-tRNA reductase [Halioglobus sp.]|jgi:glutamyl-tRNA reductase